MLNIGSIILGLVAWVLAIIYLVKYNKVDNRKGMCFSVVNVSARTGSLYMVIFYIKYLVKIADWSALMDTVPAFAFVSTGLLVGYNCT